MDSTQALIYLDSDDRIKNSSFINNGDVAFPVNFKANTVKRMALASYDFLVNFDNINESNNRVVIEDTLLVSYELIIPIGKYTHAELATAIDVAIAVGKGNGIGRGICIRVGVGIGPEIGLGLPCQLAPGIHHSALQQSPQRKSC